MKKVVMSLLIIMLCALNVQAASNKEYTKDELIKMFNTNSSEIKKIGLEKELLGLEYKSMEEKLKDYKRQSNKAEILYKNAKNSSDGTRVYEKRDAYFGAYDSWMAAKRDLADLKYKVDNQETYYAAKSKVAENNFINQLEQFIELAGQVDNAKSRLGIAKDTYDIESKKFKLGLISSLDLKRSKNDYLMADVQFKSLENLYKSSEESIKIKLNMNVNDQVALKLKEQTNIEPFLLDLSTISRAYFVSSYEYNFKLAQVESQKEYMTLIKDKYTEDHEKLEKRIIEDRKKAIAFSEYKQMKDMMFIKEYYDLKDKADNYTKEAEALKLAQTKLVNSEISFKSGTISELQFRLEKSQFDGSQLSYSKALNDYIKSIRKLELLLNGVEV